MTRILVLISYIMYKIKADATIEFFKEKLPGNESAYDNEIEYLLKEYREINGNENTKKTNVEVSKENIKRYEINTIMESFNFIYFYETFIIYNYPDENSNNDKREKNLNKFQKTFFFLKESIKHMKKKEQLDLKISILMLLKYGLLLSKIKRSSNVENEAINRMYKNYQQHLINFDKFFTEDILSYDKNFSDFDQAKLSKHIVCPFFNKLQVIVTDFIIFHGKFLNAKNNHLKNLENKAKYQILIWVQMSVVFLISLEVPREPATDKIILLLENCVIPLNFENNIYIFLLQYPEKKDDIQGIDLINSKKAKNIYVKEKTDELLREILTVNVAKKIKQDEKIENSSESYQGDIEMKRLIMPELYKCKVCNSKDYSVAESLEEFKAARGNEEPKSIGSSIGSKICGKCKFFWFCEVCNICNECFVYVVPQNFSKFIDLLNDDMKEEKNTKLKEFSNEGAMLIFASTGRP